MKQKYNIGTPCIYKGKHNGVITGKSTIKGMIEFEGENVDIDYLQPQPKDNTHVDKEGFSGGDWIIDERNGSLFIEAIGNDGEETYAVEICKMHGNEQIDKDDATLISQAPAMYRAIESGWLEMVKVGWDVSGNKLQREVVKRFSDLLISINNSSKTKT